MSCTLESDGRTSWLGGKRESRLETMDLGNSGVIPPLSPSLSMNVRRVDTASGNTS